MRLYPKISVLAVLGVVIYADDLIIIADSEEELITKLRLWKTGMEAKDLRVNIGMTKAMFSGPNLNTLRDSGKYPCAVYRSGVGGNSIFCTAHTGCIRYAVVYAGIRGKLKLDPTYRCSRCLGLARPIDSSHNTEIQIDDDKLDVVDRFCYLGDILCPGGGCELSSIT